MALKLIVDSLESLDEGVRGFYTEQDGKFRLDVDGVEDVTGLKSALEKERSARRDLEKKMKAALSDDDLEEYARLKAEAEKSKPIEERFEMERKRTQKELEAERKARMDSDSRFRNREKELAAIKLIGGVKGNVELLMPHILPEVELEEVDGKFRAVPASAGSFDEVIGSLKTRFPEAFADSGHSGSGASGGHAGAGGAKTMTRAQFDALDSTAKHAHYSAGGKVTD